MRAIFKLKFPSGVHFGAGMLGGTEYSLRADTLYSALFIEAVKKGCSEQFYSASKGGALLLSDAFPYSGAEFFLPKPMLKVESAADDNLANRKKYRKLQYVPVSRWDDYLKGGLNDNDIDSVKKEFGRYEQVHRAAVSGREEALPYQVGTFYFDKDCGLYFIVEYKEKFDCDLVCELLNLLSYTGIGGKRSSGLGRFSVEIASEDGCRALCGLLDREGGAKQMLLCGALPKEDEVASVLTDASYLLERRSGFVASETYADQWRKKRDLYVFKVGSCFSGRFSGDIYDVSSEGGRHPVYRYAKGMFIGI